MRPTCSLSFVHEGLMLLGLYEVYAHSLLGLVRVRREMESVREGKGESEGEAQGGARARANVSRGSGVGRW